MIHLWSVVTSSLIFISLVPVILAQIQDISNESPHSASSPDLTRAHVDLDPDTVRQRGLCRDGWSRGSIIDFSGVEIPVCMRVNPQLQTWSEAQDTCRQDYGFLLKLDSPARINNVNLVASLSDQGIRQFWTGLHTYADHLVWDDLIPNAVRQTNASTSLNTPTRPWEWADKIGQDSSELCGFLDIDEDDKKRRRKRAPDDDSPDNPFDGLRALQDSMFQFQRQSSEFLPTGAFESILARKTMIDQLQDPPGTSLGIFSEQQIPGTGLSDTNLQSGSLFTHLQSNDPSSKTDTDDKETSNFENGGSTNIMQSDSFSATENPNSQSKLLSNIKEMAAKLEDTRTNIQEKMLDAIEKGLNVDTDKIGEQSANKDMEGVSAPDSGKSKDVPSMDFPESGSENINPTDDKSNIDIIGNSLMPPDLNTLIETQTMKSNSDHTEIPPTENNEISNKETAHTQDSELLNDLELDKTSEIKEKTINVDDFKENTNVQSVDNAEKMDANDNTMNPISIEQVNDLNIPQTLFPENEMIEKDIFEKVDSIATNDGMLSGVIDEAKSLDSFNTVDSPSTKISDDMPSHSDILSDASADTSPTDNDVSQNIEKLIDDLKDDKTVSTDDVTTTDFTNDDSNPLETIPDSVENLATEEKMSEDKQLWTDLVSDIKDNLDDDNNLDDSSNSTNIIRTSEQIMDDFNDDYKKVPSLDDLNEVGNRTDDDNDDNKFEISDSENNTTVTLNDISEKLNDYLEETGKGSTDVLSEINSKEFESGNIYDSNDKLDTLFNKDDIFSQLDDADEIKTSEFVHGSANVEKLDDPIESIIDGIGMDEPAILEEKNEKDKDDLISNNSINSYLDDVDSPKTTENENLDQVPDDNLKTETFDDRKDVFDNGDDKFESLTEFTNDLNDDIELEDNATNHSVGETDIQDDFKPQNEVDDVDSITDIKDEEPKTPELELAETFDDRNEMNEISDDAETVHHIDEDTDTIRTNDDVMDLKHENTDFTSDDLEPEDTLEDVANTDFYSDDLEPEDTLEDVRTTPDLAEDIETGDQKTLIASLKQKMDLSTCRVRLPSVCFSYEVEVMTTASTCDLGWYGHVLLDSCYKILDGKFTYRQAVGMCKSLGGSRVALGESGFERSFILKAVHKDGQLFRGEKFWMETTSTNFGCKYFDERGVTSQANCEATLSIVCVKDAKSLSVHIAETSPYFNTGNLDISAMDAELKLFPSRYHDNKLICDLTSAASEFPVLWFKDGILVETKDKYISPDISLHINESLTDAFRRVTSRSTTLAALQGKYWCEVWDRKSLTRKRSRPYDVRFSDVVTFHGSIQLRDTLPQQAVLFNMMNEKFPRLVSIETDLKAVFGDTLDSLRAAFPDALDVFTFIDRVRSTPSVVEYHTYYTLRRDYTAADEDGIYTRVKAVLKSKLANPKYMAALPGQTPVATFRTMSLQSTVSCPEVSLQTDVDVNGRTIPIRRFNFPKAQLGDFANSIDICSPTNSYPAGTARCLGDFSTGAYWGGVVANECIDESAIDKFNGEIWGASPFTDKLTEMARTVIQADNVERVVSQIAHITEVAARLTPTDVNKIADVLDHSTQVGKLSEKVGNDVLKTIDKLMSSSEKEVHVANVETKAANRIIKSLERYAEKADIGNKGNVRMVSDNVVVELWDLKPNADRVIGLAAETQSKSMGTAFKDEIIATVFNRTQLDNANVDAAIELPREVFDQKEKGVSLGSRLTMMVFRKSKLFEAALSSDGNILKATEKQLNNLNSYVISASIAGKKLTGLKERVRTIFRPLKERDGTPSCVWWDFDMNESQGGWSQAGCYYDGKINGRDICLCDHLTNFAVLLDFYGQSAPIPAHHELSLSIITVLGLALSILGLSLTIISYVFFRKLRQGRAQQTLFNLSLALLFSMLVFLVGIKQTHSYVGCLVVAILLHYFILASFMWMLMEAILQYLTFVKILGTYITRFTLKTVLPAWGLPLIPVIAVLSVDYHLYHGGPQYCWMDLPAFYFAFAIPITSIIIINIIIFLITIISIFRRGKGLRSNQKKQKMAMTNLQAAITSFILLGLTWVFGYLAIADARLPFQYVFTILNSLQGFFIFILFVVRKKKVRDQWYIICCKGGEKDRVSRSLSASNSIPSSYSNGSRKSKHERDRSDSTKTTQSIYSNSSGGFTNYGYDTGYEVPYARNGRRLRQF